MTDQNTFWNHILRVNLNDQLTGKRVILLLTILVGCSVLCYRKQEKKSINNLWKQNSFENIYNSF